MKKTKPIYGCITAIIYYTCPNSKENQEVKYDDPSFYDEVGYKGEGLVRYIDVKCPSCGEYHQIKV